MPLSAYRNWIGVAKITSAGVIPLATASSATSIVVNSVGTAPTTSMSVVFLDGPNTETKAISAVTGTGPYTLTIAATTNAHPVNCYVYLQLTASPGPTNYIPLKTFTVPDKIPQIYDETYRSNMVTKYGVAGAMRSAEWTFAGDVFADTFGFFAKGLFGAEDYAAGPPKSHTIGVQNTGTNAVGEYGQPDYYAMYVFDVTNTRVVVGKFTELGIKFDPKANLNFTSKLLARASGVVANPTLSFSSIVPIPAWRASCTWNSVAVRNPMTAEYTFTRTQSEAIPTLQGNQDAYGIFVGAVEAGAKYSWVKEDDSILSLFEAGTQYPVSLALTQGTGATELGLTIQTTSCNSDTDENKLQGKAYNTEDVAFTCLGNSTDVTTAGGGQGNAVLTLLNAIGTGVY
jgi:hypothetical protein